MKKQILFLGLLIFTIVLGNLNTQIVYGSYEEVENISFNHNGIDQDINFINPVKFVAILDGNGYPVDADIVINNKRARAGNIAMYTADWHLTHTGLETKFELVIVKENNSFVIKEINPNGNSYIPLDGFVLAFGETPINYSYEVGDTITLSGYDFSVAKKAIESTNGARVLIDAVNSTRSQPMIVYYDSNYGEMTGNNQWGVELTVELDETLSTFSITDAREIGEGDSKGIDIPYFGFVISAYGDPYRLKLAPGVLFDIDDEIIVTGIPFIDLAATVETTYDFLNPTREENPFGMEDEFTPFPSLRGPDQLNIYTDDWDNTLEGGDGSGTGANEWGYEIAVNSFGIVVETGINVSVIPEGGFVASGHGIGRDWLRSNAILGSECSYDESSNTLTLTTTADSYISVIKDSRDTAQGMALDAERKLYDIDVTEAFNTINLLNEEITLLENLSSNLKNNPDNFSELVRFKQALDNAKNMVNKVVYLTYESRVVDSRGIWHRPNNAGYNELTLEGVESFLDDLVYNNINSLYVETFFHGYVVGTNITKTSLHPWLNGGEYGEYGDDYLKALISEAKKRNIEVHAWVQNFNVGFEGMAYPEWLSSHPEWIIYNDDNTFLQRNEGGKYIFADPANPEVQSFLLDLYEELMTNYEFDGLHLDYIRYPVTYRQEDTGYTTYAIDEFISLNNLDTNSDLRNLVKTDDTVYEKWTDYKTQKVTSFVEEVVNMMNETHSSKIISTAIFPDILEATVKKNQDWPTWVKNGWIDVTTPMAYYSGASTVESKVSDMVTYVDGITLNYGGIAPAFMGLSVENNPLQAQAVRDGHAFGTVIFASQNLTGYGSASNSLSLGIYSKPAVLPHSDIHIIINTMKEDLVGENSKADRIYIPNEKMTVLQRDSLKQELERINQMPATSSLEIEAIIEEIETIINSVNDYGSGFADNRIKDDLSYLVEILEVRVTRFQIDEGIWVKPGTTPADPTPNPEPTDPVTTTCDDGYLLENGECVLEVKETGCFGTIDFELNIYSLVIPTLATLTLIILRKKQN